MITAHEQERSETDYDMGLLDIGRLMLNDDSNCFKVEISSIVC